MNDNERPMPRSNEDLFACMMQTLCPFPGEEVPQQLPAIPHGVRYTIITFTYNGRVGVPLTDAIRDGDLPGLEGANKQDLFSSHRLGTKISHKIMWPGYTPYSKQKHITMMNKGIARHITRREVVRHVAQAVATFISERSNFLVDGEHLKWKVGPAYIQLENLVLVGLKKVSRSGVQPVLVYRKAPRELQHPAIPP